MKCPKCGSEHAVKYGKVCGKQRWQCKECGCQFTSERSHGYTLEEKLFAMTLLVAGLSMNAVAGVLGVSVQTVMRWKKSGLIDSDKIDKAAHAKKVSRSGKIKLIKNDNFPSAEKGGLNAGDFYLLETRLASGVCVDIAVKRNGMTGS